MNSIIEFTDSHVIINKPSGQTAIGSHIRALLSAMESNGDAELIDKAYLISHTGLICLSEEDLAILDAPPFYPYQIKIDSKGSFSDIDFKYNITFLNEDGKPYLTPERTGSLLKVGNQEFILHPSQYQLITEIDTFNSELCNDISKSERQYQYMKPFVNIKKFAELSNSKLDDYLQEQNIILPESIQPEIEINEDGSIKIKPQIGNISESEEGSEFTESLTDEQNEAYRRKLSTTNYDRKTVKIKTKQVKSVWVLNSPKVREGLKELSAIAELDTESASDFLNNPHQYLTSKVFYLDQFSERVIEVAEMKYVSNVGVARGRMKIDWDNLILTIADPTSTKPLRSAQINSPNDLKILESAVCRAREEHKNYFIYKGIAIERNDDELDRFIEGTRDIFVLEGKTGGDKYNAAKNARKLGIDRESKSLGLIIKNNIDQVEEKTEELGVDNLQIELKLPQSLNPSVKLYDFQKEGVQWLQNLCTIENSGAMLADDMGLGKTLQILSFLIEKMEDGDKGPFLVMAPVTLLENWNDEQANMFLEPYRSKCLVIHSDFMKRHGTRGAQVTQRDGTVVDLPMKKVIDEDGKNKIINSGIVITNYETIRDYQLSFGEIKFKVIVCDEAQKIKNPRTHITNAVKGMNAEFRIISTATPVENSLVDLWCLVDFLKPGKLGSLREFSKEYVPAQDETVKPEKIRALRETLDKDNLILRRTKKEQLKDLPDKTIVEENVDLSQWQMELYANLLYRAKQDTKQTLPVILSLIALCSHPGLLVPGDIASVDELLSDCPKLEWTINQLKNIKAKDDKVLIFTRFKKMQKILLSVLYNEFPDIGEIGLINGETPPKIRQKIINKFNQSEYFNILILSPEAAGVGLNITGANHVIHYTRLWNPAKEDQATDRVYRIGQKKDVYVYYPITVFPLPSSETDKTIEEHLHDLLSVKRDVMKEFLTPTESLDIQKELLNKIDFGEKDTLKPMTLSDVDKLSWEQFEIFIALLFQKKGYKTEFTGKAADYGVDVVVLNQDYAGYALVQCKFRTGESLPASGVREVVTAKKFYEEKFRTKFGQLYLATTASPTKETQELASSNNVEILDKTQINQMMQITPITWSEVFTESSLSIS